MHISIFDLFSIGIGPSSSHTVGPMRAAKLFALTLQQNGILDSTNRVFIELFGSLAFTGRGHGTDHAILMGLEGEEPATIDTLLMKTRIKTIQRSQQLNLLNHSIIDFNITSDLMFNQKDLLPHHNNGMRFTALNNENHTLLSSIYYSIGGGFIITDTEAIYNAAQLQPLSDNSNFPYQFNNARTLLQLCHENNFTIAELMLENEKMLHTTDAIEQRLMHIAAVMHQCILTGCETEGVLPGGLNVRRRAPQIYKQLVARGKPKTYEYESSLDWLNLFAIAVNEENANGGRIVTAPTNGAAGILPAVLEYYLSFYPQAKAKDASTFLLTAGAIAMLYKKNASLSGAEVGCQGEIGVACSMAAAALTALLGGNLNQIENAAEIAMEHHLGMTCDPIHGLVQIPCIERNAMGAMKAVNAARLALLGDGSHYVSLDKVIATMRQTGKDMMHKYKETSLGGLAVNLPEC